MANKKMKKVPLDKDCLMEAILLKNTSIRKLGADHKLGWSSKSIERGIKDGEVSPELLNALGKYLDVEPDYLSGKYHRICEKNSDDYVCSLRKRNLCAKYFPYIIKQQKEKYDDVFLYDKYLEYILIIHDISLSQFQSMPFEQQKELQLSIEDAIVPVLMKFFSQNAMGQDVWPEIYRLRCSIDSYDPNEPEPPEDFFLEDTENSSDDD